MDRNELLARIEAGRKELEAEIARFDRQEINAPLLPNGWSIKDVVAHIGFWEGRIAGLYDILKAGEIPEGAVDLSTVDELNNRVYEENQLIPWGIVQVNEEEAYRALLAVAEKAPDDDLFNPDRFPWTQGTPFSQYIVENTNEHYNDHLPDLRAIQSE